MSTFSIDALVLGRRDIGEADRLLTVFSRTLGKLRIVAKGVRRPTSRMSAHLEPGRESRLLLVERRSLPLVTQAQTQTVYLSRNADLTELRDLFSLLEVTSNLLDDQQRDSRLYDLLVATLEQCRRSAPSNANRRTALAAAYILKALHMLGYAIELQSCVECGKTFELTHKERLYLSASRGGVLHAACSVAGKIPGTFSISGTMLGTMRTLLMAQLADVTEIESDTQDGGSALLNPLKAVVEWHAERPLKSSLL